MTIKQTLIAASLGLLFAGNALAVVPAAGITNGNFSQALTTGWETMGDVAKSFGSVVMTTASLGDDDYPELAGTFNASGNPAIDFAAIDLAAAANALGIDVSGMTPEELAEFEADAAAVSEGSFLMQSFSYSAGQTLSFDWNFYTNESSPNFNDSAFVVIDGELTELASVADAATASLPFAWSTGKQHFSHTFTTSGSGVLAFGVVDQGDYNNTSALWLDNVTVVPEPETYALMLAGLGLVGMMARRRKI